jgi:tetratricopeptide (TPR) repeat protein
MKTIYADYNAATEAGHLCLTTVGSREDIERAGLGPGDWAWLSDSEVIVGAQLAVDDYYGLVGVPDWDTLIPLDDEGLQDFDAVETEFLDLEQKQPRSQDEERRLLQLLTAYDYLAPKQDQETLAPADLSFLRAETLERLDKSELALVEIESARRLGANDPALDWLFLGILGRFDGPRARREAETLAANPDLSALVLAECINVMAIQADDLPDDQFRDVAGPILAWADRFDRAPDREGVPGPTRALLDFNRGITLLRLGRLDEARAALRRAKKVDPARFARLDELMELTNYHPLAHDLAARVRAGLTAA